MKRISETSNTIPFAATALLQHLVMLLEAKGVLDESEVEKLFKDAADSQSNTDVSSFLADMNAEQRRRSKR